MVLKMFNRADRPPRGNAARLFLLLLIPGIVYLIGNHPLATGPAEGNQFTGFATTQPSGPYLRIGTFNIDGGQGADQRVDLDRTASCMQKLDFVAMNEVHGFVFGDPQNQAITLSQSLQMPYLYVPAEKQWGRPTFGNAVFSALPIKHWLRVELPSQPFRAKRNYLLTDADWRGRDIHFLTTHTDWKSGGVEQFQSVRDLFLKLPEPAILMGDLNTPASNPLIANLQKTPGVEEAIGQILDKIPGRVDWIFLRGLKTVDAGQVDLKASDHPAYWAQVKLK
jgi:endonuclease/exonuclease/phosphatase family metal-dependent hydrolase